MVRKMMTIAALGFSLALVLGFIPSSLSVMAGQEEGFTEKGRDLYRQYCASCHGIDAKGRGPAAVAMKTPPPDLTVIQKKGEKFPSYKVMTVIEGEKVLPAHGSREMPIWGTIFRRTKDAMREHGDIYALMKYIESIQKPIE
ncbi:MAG: cytochrome c [Acidobacteria bacterium]|nr:cytochrome c [Acidobacteriota bacterium]